jgi:hypothetical protein
MTQEWIWILIICFSGLLMVGVIGGIMIAVGRGVYNLMTTPVWIISLIAVIAILVNFIH